MCDILAHLFRIPVNGKPITILDISGIPSEVLNVVVSVFCRLTFDFAMWSETPIPITIVCEEAHRYAPRDKVSASSRQSERCPASPRRAANMAFRCASSANARPIWRRDCCRSAIRSSRCA